MRRTTSAPGIKAFATSERTVAELDEAIVLAFLDDIGAVEDLGPFQAFTSSPVSHQAPLNQAIGANSGPGDSILPFLQGRAMVCHADATSCSHSGAF